MGGNADNTRILLSYVTVHVSSYDPSDPTSYMTCIGGAPLTGVHCRYDGVNNVCLGIGGRIALNVTIGFADMPPFLVNNVNV